jgi:hypothetical protein
MEFFSTFFLCSLLVYRKVINIFKLILYPASLLMLFMLSRSFLKFFRFLGIRACHLQIGELDSIFLPSFTISYNLYMKLTEILISWIIILSTFLKNYVFMKTDVALCFCFSYISPLCFNGPFPLGIHENLCIIEAWFKFAELNQTLIIKITI